MIPERWRRLEGLFQQALEREPPQRESFLREACAGDEEMRREVESLLGAHDQADGFLSGTGALNAMPPAAGDLLAPGRRVGAYEIVSLLARGGMGEVYRARDRRLAREVALKVLPAASVADEPSLRRFQQEARTTGALNHPNIVAVFDVGAVDAVHYVVCELLEGETLEERMRRPAPVAVTEAAAWARQIASGLVAAHDKGIVHRDLKPANLFLTRDGRVKILDFGLAKLRIPARGHEPGPEPTGPGVLLGTTGYMSPEQARGEEADERSDVFSFGAVLYEMLARRRAFAGSSPVASLTAVLTGEPDFAALPAEAPAALVRVLRRCLQKRPEHRYDSATPLAAALAEAEHALAAGAAAVRARAVAVLPFRDLAPDPEGAHLGLGLADAAITELAQLGSLVVRPTSAVLRYLDRPVDAREAARELGVDAVLESRVQRAGASLRVTMQLVDGVDGRTLWAAKLDAALDDLFSLQDEVARRVAEALHLELTPSDERRLGQRERERAAAGEAYAYYLKGKAQLYRESLADCIRAVDWFEKARAADPGFALAWAGLADAYVHIGFEFEPEGDWYTRAHALCAKALALDPGLPEARYVRGRMLWTPDGGFDHAGGLRELMAAVAGQPNLDEAYVRLGVQLFHIGLLDEAERQLERALAISPDHVIARGHVASCRFHGGRFEETLELIRPIAAHSRSYWHHYLLAHSLLRLGRLDAADEVAARMQDLGDEAVGHGHAIQGLVAALRGDAEGARAGAARALRAKRAYGHFHHDQYDVACTHALLGQAEEALRWLGEAARSGYPCRPFFECDPLLAGARAHARFATLMDAIGAECAGYARLWRELGEGDRRG